MADFDQNSLFFPNQQIDDPKWFAGRKTDIEKALKSLCSPGASIMIYGERGVGKTSFAEMIKLLASGNSHLLFKHGFQKKYLPEKLRYKVISVDCDADANTTGKVLQRLITSPMGIKSIISNRIEKVESVVKDRQTLDLFNIIQFGSDSESVVTRAEFQEENVFETFNNLIISISKNILNTGEGLLIAIDEFDLIVDSFKMASLIKNLSKSNVKFMISGIAESYEQLLQGHISVARQFTFGRIKIDPMSFNEIADLFTIVEENSKRQVRFDESFLKDIEKRTSGYPYFVQLFGQLALDAYIDSNGVNLPIIISPKYLKNGLKVLNVFEYEMDKSYNNIIGKNPLKELIVKFMSQSISKRIKDDDIHAFCYKNGIMQPQPKSTLASLLAHRDPFFLTRDSEDSDYVSFTDPLFKIYVKSREPELLKKKGDAYFIP